MRHQCQYRSICWRKCCCAVYANWSLRKFWCDQGYHWPLWLAHRLVRQQQNSLQHADTGQDHTLFPCTRAGGLLYGWWRSTKTTRIQSWGFNNISGRWRLALCRHRLWQRQRDSKIWCQQPTHRLLGQRQLCHAAGYCANFRVKFRGPKW